MLRAVLDTNVLVSGLLSPRGPPAAVLDAVANGSLTPVYSDPIFEEYVEVLMRPALRLKEQAVLELLLLFGEVGEYVTQLPSTSSELSLTDFPDADDIPFYAAALAAGCPLVTGNLKHYPKSRSVDVINPAQAAKRLENEP